MIVEVELDGRRRAVAVQRDGERWEVTIDGCATTVSVMAAGGRWSLLTGTNSYEVAFESHADGATLVLVNGEPVRLTVRDPRAALVRRAADRSSGGRSTVTTPMPGRVVKVLVKPGDVVELRQGLVIVEAMKMENELRAPRAGTVTDVRAVEGASVEANTVLIVLE